MSAFTDLLAGPRGALEGSFHTAHEIAQQPAVWQKVLDLLDRRKSDMESFLRGAGIRGDGDSTLILCGAGSSAHVGSSISATLREKLTREVRVVPTTDIVTDPLCSFLPGRPFVVVHFARSGDSPESLAAFRLLSAARPDAAHIVITCNEQGALHREASRRKGVLCLLLPPESNDLSLAMTSSFTGMALCGLGLGFVPEVGLLRALIHPAARAAQRLMEGHGDLLARLGSSGFSRACFLGSHALRSAAQEAALKMLEMTGGEVSTVSDSFLGIRHGPRAFIDKGCLVVACLSSREHVRRYELDLLRGLRERAQGSSILAISVQDDPAARECADHFIVLAPDGESISDEVRVLTDMVACQLLSLFASRSRGLMPDSPSPSGIISRVVEGVRIYE